MSDKQKTEQITMNIWDLIQGRETGNGEDTMKQTDSQEVVRQTYELVATIYSVCGSADDLTLSIDHLKEQGHEIAPEVERLALDAIEKVRAHRAALLDGSHMGQGFLIALTSYLQMIDNMAKSGQPYEWLRSKVAELAKETAYLYESIVPGRDAEALRHLMDTEDFGRALRGEDLTSPAAVTLTKDECYDVMELCEKLASMLENDQSADPSALVDAFISSEYKRGPESTRMIYRLTRVRKSNHVIISTSKASKKMTEIAAIPEGVLIDVGGTGKYSAEIFARIGDEESKPYTPSHMHKHLQDTIGQLGEENGYPMSLTPAQIYRAFAGLDRDAVVWPEQEAEIEKAMDALIFTPASIDFTEQAEKHPRSRRDSSFDYTKAKVTGNLITAEKGSIKRGEVFHTAYVIFSPPVFYRYSKAVGQLKQVDIRLLSSTTKKNYSKTEKAAGATPHKSKTSASGGTRNTVIRRYLADRVTDMQKAAKANRKEGLAGHQRRIAYASIAEQSDTILTPKTIRTIRDITERILNDFVNLKQIKGFEIYKEGSAYKGIEIKL